MQFLSEWESEIITKNNPNLQNYRKNISGTFFMKQFSSSHTSSRSTALTNQSVVVDVTLVD